MFTLLWRDIISRSYLLSRLEIHTQEVFVNALSPRVISGFLAKKGIVLQGLADDRERIAESMEQIVPENLKPWLEVIGRQMIFDLLNFAQSMRYIQAWQVDGLGFANLEEMNMAFEGLQKAWKGNVKIETIIEGGTRLQVRFTPYSLPE